MGGGISDLRYNKAFTLIELLAIIVILAIIAVITIPIILNVIENSRKGAAIDSAYGYKDAITKYYVTELFKDTDYELENGNYIVDDGLLIYKNNTYMIPISGTAPDSGYVTIKNNEMIGACLTINDYKVELKDDKFTTYGKGECPNEPPIKFGGDVVDGDKLAALGPGYTGVKAIVYLDPTNLETECNESLAVSTNETKSGCMKWYVFKDSNPSNDKEGIYTMILDHNTTSSVAWNNNDGDDSTNTAGPSTQEGQLLWQLDEDTKKWKVATDEDPNGIKLMTSDDNYDATIAGGTSTQNIIFVGKKARLISAEEVAQIIGYNGFTLSFDHRLIDTDLEECNDNDNCSKGQSKYAWLFDRVRSNCEIYGCANNAEGNTTFGYWTSSPCVRPSYSNYRNAWHVSSDGYFVDYNVSDSSRGIRPVIKVSKSLLKK